MCLRIVRMRGVDLTLFQFDYDLTWAGLFLESDGTILGRYGAGARDSMHYNSLDGLKNAMIRALDLHQNIKKYRPLLAGKKDQNVVFKLPRDLPHSGIKKTLKNDTKRKNCVHCHMVQEGLNYALELEPGYHPDRVRSRFPAPEGFGVVLDVDHGLRVKQVLPNTGAKSAGIKPGDELVEASGQTLISVADFIWSLRSVPDPGVAKVTIRRDGKLQKLSVALQKGWKPGDLAWRESVYAMRPKLQLWVEPAPQKARRNAKIAENRLALRVRGVFGKEVRKAGFKVGDLVIGVSDWHPNVSPPEFNQYLKLNYYKSGSEIPIVVARGGRRVTLTLKF